MRQVFGNIQRISHSDLFWSHTASSSTSGLHANRRFGSVANALPVHVLFAGERRSP
ncbi:hypothetical protein CCHR01_11003 [Colletotrichum chrysophilum]|uniref:Uncharacterized protein n=1 Tax=Colletotrichum chrysophilum TaxID=1836956 RepID=A0AAD9AGN8_9PEZI|nr:hypothetical protein CCHR01_11003 [Colletotrichum chrysophilum]